MNLADVYTQDTYNTSTTVTIAMDDQTVLELPTPLQQSVALAPLAGQSRKRPKLTVDLDDESHGDSTKEAIVAVLIENTDGDPGDLIVEGDRVSSPFMPVSQDILHPRKSGTPTQFFLGKWAHPQEIWYTLSC